MSSGGKSGAGGGSKSYNYYGTIASLWHVGQMDRLTGIIMDDKLVWEGSVARIYSTNPVEITIPGRGIYRHWWGTEDQLTVDPILLSGGNSGEHSHPAYTGLCGGIFVDILFGQERTQSPTVAIRGERTPVQSLITGDSALLVDGQANPFCILAELLLNERFGLGMAPAMFASASWQTAADRAALKPEICYVSPIMTGAESVASVAQDLFALCDGFLRAETGTGLCEAGMFTAPEDIDPELLVYIDSTKIVSEPELAAETWDDVKTTWNVRFRDRDYNFKTRSLSHDDPAALQRVGDVRPQDLQRDSIVRYEQALSHAREWGRRFSTPGISGKESVRAESVADLRPGDHALIDIQTEPGAVAVNKIFRVLEISRSVKGVAKIKVDAVRSLSPVSYATAVVVIPPASYSTPCLSSPRIFELPLDLGNANYKLGVLSARPDSLVTDFSVLYDSEETGDYQPIGGSRGFALKAHIFDPIVESDTGPFRIELEGTLDREILAESPGTVAADDDTVLMIVFKLDGDAIEQDRLGRDYVEIFSCSAFTAESGNKILVDALRSRQGTYPRDFDADDEVWIIRKSSLSPLEHSDFEELAGTGAPAYIDIQTGSQSGINTGCPPIPFQFPPERRKPPVEYKDLFNPYVLVPSSASIGVACKTRGGTRTLVGFEEFTSPSVPPKKYLRKVESGTSVSSYWADAACSVPQTPPGNTCTHDSVCQYNAETGVLVTTGAGLNCTDGATAAPSCANPSFSPGCEYTWSLTKTEADRIAVTAHCCSLGGGNWAHQISDSLKWRLSGEDTDDDAQSRLEETLTPWADIVAGSCTGVISYWESRGTGEFSADKFDAKAIFSGTLYYAHWEYTITVYFERQLLSGGAWEDAETVVVGASADGGGAFIEEIDYPNLEGYQHRMVRYTIEA